MLAYFFSTSENNLMDIWRLAAMSVIFNFSSTLETKEGIRVHRSDIGIQNHWQAILLCAVIYPSHAHENCTRIWWSHKIDRISHMEENPEDNDDIYRITTDLVKDTSQLRILSFNEKGKGLYKCQAECGNHLYAATCMVQDLPHTNRSALCAEKVFKEDTPDTQLVSDSEPITPALLGASIGIALLAAILLTGFLRWMNKRRETRKRFRQALHDLSRPPVPRVHQPPQRPSSNSHSSSTSRPIRQEVQVRNVSLPPVPPTLFFNTSGPVPDQVVYQQMPDGSQIVFIPAAKLPSYEDSVANDRGAMSVSERCKSVIDSSSRVTSQTQAGASTSIAGRGASPALSGRSLPPSYGSIYGGQPDADTGAAVMESNENQNNDLEDVEESLSNVEGPSSSNSAHPSCVPLLSDTSERAVRLPKWIVGYPPPQYEDSD